MGNSNISYDCLIQLANRFSDCSCESPEWYQCKRSRRSCSRFSDNNEPESKSHDNR